MTNIIKNIGTKNIRRIKIKKPPVVKRVKKSTKRLKKSYKKFTRGLN